MADVVDLNQRRKPTDPELIESLRIMLSEAQSGSMVSMVAISMSDAGEVSVVAHSPYAIEAVGMASLLHDQMRKQVPMNDDD